MILFSLWALCIVGTATAKVTVYGQIPLGQTTTAGADGSQATTAPLLAAYDETTLKPPALPDAPPAPFTLALPGSSANVVGLSIPHKSGSFFGFSIEMSVVSQVVGKNSTHILVPFLNLLSILQERAGSVNIRIGGNTQDFAKFVDHIDDGHALAKEKGDPKNPTYTPAVTYTLDMFYMAGNISSLVNTRWFFGIPFIDTNWQLQIMEHGQAILGDKILGFQAGNEPDLYSAPGHDHRPTTYSELDYFKEFGSLVQAIGNNQAIPNKNMLIGPSLATGPWLPERVWNTGYLNAYGPNLAAIAMEHYPSNNCFARFNVGSPVDPQTAFPQFLTHKGILDFVGPYLNTSNIAQQAQKPFIMFETNTATCGGLPGISDSFGAALWALDYGFTMAASNFSNALFHFGGQNVYYNPITAPPTNQTAFNQWTVGSIFYSIMIVAEALGASNTSQVIDTTGDRALTPSFSIYENGALARVALFNYNDDLTTGTFTITPNITVDGGQVPAQVKVKYFDAKSVSVKTNLTWAGQTFGNKFEVDGRLKGNQSITTINCNKDTNTCSVPVKAPGFALVFLTEPAGAAAQPADPTHTFATTAFTKTVNTIFVDPTMVQNSNGISGKDRDKMGSTSPGSRNAALGGGPPGTKVVVALLVAAGVVAGVLAG